jgi:PilZ domain
LNPADILGMEQRRESRFAASQSVVVTVLDRQARQQAALVKNASSRGLAIQVPNAIAPGTAIQIEFENSMVPAEAVYCRGGPDSWLVGVELDPVLCSLSQLGRKLQELSDGVEVGTPVRARLGKQKMPRP